MSGFVRAVPFGPVRRILSSWFGRANLPRRRLRSGRAGEARRALPRPAFPSPSSAKRRARHFDTRPANDETIRAYPSGCAKHPVSVLRRLSGWVDRFGHGDPRRSPFPRDALCALCAGPRGGCSSWRARSSLFTPCGTLGDSTLRTGRRDAARRFRREGLFYGTASARSQSLHLAFHESGLRALKLGAADLQGFVLVRPTLRSSHVASRPYGSEPMCPFISVFAFTPRARPKRDLDPRRVRCVPRPGNASIPC